VKNNRYFRYEGRRGTATSVFGGKSSINFLISQRVFAQNFFSKIFCRYQLNLFEAKRNRYFVSKFTATLPLLPATFSCDVAFRHKGRSQTIKSYNTGVFPSDLLGNLLMIPKTEVASSK
jgi:hypothetical protein